MIKSKRKHPMVAGDVNWFEAELQGCKYLKSLGYKKAKKSFYSKIFRNAFDFVTERGVFEIKAKKLPSTQPYTFNFTNNQINYYREHYPKKISYFKILVQLTFPDNHTEWKILDFSEDFLDIDKEIIFRWGRKNCAGGGCVPIRFKVKKESRSWCNDDI